MRDLAVFLFLIGCIFAAFWRPWLGVLALAVFSYMNPHAYAWTFMRSFPAYQVLFIAAAFAFLTAREKQALPRDWRVLFFFALWAYFLITTVNAKVPDPAWQKLLTVSKIYLPFVFTMWLIDTPKKMHYLIATIGGSLGIVAAKGGLFALATGFSYRTYGPTGTQFGGNNEFAIATLMAIPLLVLWARETPYKWLRQTVYAVIPLCFASALASHSRGAAIAAFVLLLLLLWHGKRKILILPVLAAGLVVGGQMLPEKWYERMHTIENYQESASAMSRIRAWKDGVDYALEHPVLGAGFEGWRYVTYRDWHSSYVEMLAEHGFIAFALWLSIVVGTVFSLTRLLKYSRTEPNMAWVENYAAMLRASLLVYMVGTLFLGLSYWDILYHIVFISVLLKQFAYQHLPQPALELRRAVPEPQRHVDRPVG
mgnify:CR=1 FL=1